MKVTKTLSLNEFVIRLASLGAVWQQGVIPQEQTTRWTGDPDFYLLLWEIKRSRLESKDKYWCINGSDPQENKDLAV
ncbi:hypothetical protein [Paenibacillus illinoisensis]|uniref:hypothetical protein n=1 Tax=Paenibacillus illinoisensis TaxID=59845 RepID=UPI00301E56F2